MRASNQFLEACKKYKLKPGMYIKMYNSIKQFEISDEQEHSDQSALYFNSTKQFTIVNEQEYLDQLTLYSNSIEQFKIVNE